MQIPSDLPIYRFMNLFELYELAVHQKLKFTRLRLMSDKNEGLGEVLKQQSNQLMFQLRNDRERLKASHQEVRDSTYISCWTGVRDAMAMWLLYSQSHAAFRVKTSEGKLRMAMQANDEDLYGTHGKVAPGTAVPFYWGLSPVKYVDLRSIHQLSREKLEAFDLRVASAHRKGEAGNAELKAALGDRDTAKVELLKQRAHLKDVAYEHEKEVRAWFQLRVRNEMSLEEYRALPTTANKVFGNPMLDDATSDNSPDVVSILVKSDFIEEICFDSRMPDYNQKTVQQMLDRVDIPYVTTPVFGSLMDEIDLTIREIY